MAELSVANTFGTHCKVHTIINTPKDAGLAPLGFSPYRLRARGTAPEATGTQRE